VMTVAMLTRRIGGAPFLRPRAVPHMAPSQIGRPESSGHHSTGGDRFGISRTSDTTVSGDRTQAAPAGIQPLRNALCETALRRSRWAQLTVNVTVRLPTFPIQSHDVKVAVWAPGTVGHVKYAVQLYVTLSHVDAALKAPSI